ncbi:MAG TPA: lactate racemase domain-containing protein, partial [Candidatus Saccharimonadia bacterium]|nr:lactate racemase domain-containing protein [Candidatus Saccharimonadia bacterium]
MSLNVPIAYGRGHLTVSLPEALTTVIEPAHQEGLADEQGALHAALENPVGTHALREWLKPGGRVCIVFTDITRATPNERLIPWLLAYLHEQGVPREAITLLNSTGTHRPNTKA